MKKKEILYSALSGISEDKAADAYEYTNYNRKKAVFQSVLKGAGIAAIICSFIVASFILQALSGPKTVPDETNSAASLNETSSDAETEASVTTDTTVKETETEEEKLKVTSEREAEQSRSSVDPGVVELTFEELSNISLFKDFLPTYYPENFKMVGAHMLYSGDYNTDYEPIELHVYTYDNSTGVFDKPVEEDVSFCDLSDVQFWVWIKKTTAGYEYHAPEDVTVQTIKDERQIAGHYSKIKGEKIHVGYNFRFTVDGWDFMFQYAKLFDDDSTNYDIDTMAQYLYDIVTSSQYFKDHPLSVN